MALHFVGDPDFILLINGLNVTREVKKISLHDNSEKMSNLKVTLRNPNLRLSGVFNWEQIMQIRLGYNGRLNETATLIVSEVEETGDGEKGLEVIVTGVDDTHKLSGGNRRGKIRKKQGKDAPRYLA